MSVKEGWSFRQHFSLRAGTMLLAFCGGLAGLAFAEPLYQVIVRALPAADNILWRFGVNFERYLLSAAAFSLFFLVRSIFRKEPQAQFVIEIILAALLYSLL
ncbi:MAG: hypothetical protein ABFS18_03410 [Thermodesulfobacteriota bacterium]